MATEHADEGRRIEPQAPADHGPFVNALERITDFFGTVAVWLVPPTILLGLANVILRRIGAGMGRSLTSNALIEMQWYLYGVIFLLSLAYVLKNQVNVRVDFWFANRSVKTKAWIDFIGHFVGLIPFCVIGIWVSINPVLFSWQIREGSPDPSGLPRYPIKTMILVGLVLLSIQAVAELFKLIRVLRGIESYDVSKQPLRVE